MKMQKDPFSRFRIRFWLVTVCLVGGAAGFLALDAMDFFDAFLFCPLHVFGIYCPGCGGTRAVWRILQGDLVGALAANPLVFLLGGVTAWYYAFAIAALWRRDVRLFRRAGTRPAWVLFGAAILFFILRNVLLFCGIDPLGDFSV